MKTTIMLCIQVAVYVIAQTLLPVHSTNNDIEVQLSAKMDLAKEEPLNTTRGVGLFKNKMQKYTKTIKLFIRIKNFTLVTLAVKRSRRFIPKHFVYKYFTKKDIQVRKHFDNGYRRSYCYFTGNVKEVPESVVSLNLCDGIKGVIKFYTLTCSIRTIVIGSEVHHRLYIQREPESGRHNNRYANLTDSLLNFLLYYNTTEAITSNKANSGHRTARSVKPSGSGSDLSTYYIEMYVVLDNSFYIANGRSVGTTIDAGFAIVNFAAALYSKLNVYIVLVGIEVWNNRNRLDYTYTTDGKLDAGQLLTELNKYRELEISRTTHNDNIQLFTKETFYDGVLGRGDSSGICSSDISGGVNYDRAADFTHVALTMAHELGHNLGLPHADQAYEGRSECLCRENGTSSFENCIMTSSSSK